MRIIIPWPPDGSTDIVGRLLAAELTNRFRQQVIIDNRAGATGIVGMTVVRKNSHGGFREGGRLQASASSGMMRACCTGRQHA